MRSTGPACPGERGGYVAGTEHLTVERDGSTVIVTMNRPGAREGFSPPLVVGLADARAAAESATSGVFEARRGLFPLGGSTVRLARQIPYPAAMEILLTGRAVSATEAERIGLVGRVVPDGQALAEAKRIAALIGENGPLAVEAIKRSVRETEGLPEDEALKIELEIGWPIFGTEDAKEGPRAFAQKRPPAFKRRLPPRG